MRRAPTTSLLAVILLAALLLAPGLAPAQSSARTVVVRPMGDLLMGNIDGAFDAAFHPRTGELWYATGAGVVHVNAAGTAREVFAVAEGLPSPLVHALAFDAAGVLWLGTDAGLARLDPATRAVRYWNPANDPTAPANIVSLVYPDPVDASVVWVGTQQKGLARFDSAALAWTGRWNTSAETNDPVLTASANAEAVYFAARNSGYLRYDRATGALAPVEEPERYAFHSANAVLADADVTWFGTDAGTWKLDAGAWTRYNGTVLSDVRVYDVERRGTEVWMATRTGVSVLDEATGNWTLLGRGHGIVANEVRALAVTPARVAFATLSGVSVMELPSRAVSNFVTGPENGPLSNSLLGGAYHRGRVWFGTALGASAFDPSRQSWLSFSTVDAFFPASLPVYDVVSDEDRVWFATNKYVWLWNETSKKLTYVQDTHPQASNTFFHVEVDGDTLWLPEWNQGLLRYDWKTNETERYDFTNSALVDWLVTDAEATPDSVWVSTYSGLFRFDKTTKLFTSAYAEHDGFPTPELDHIWPDGRDLWVASRDGGLVRFSTETKAVTGIYNASNGALPGNNVRALVREGGTLWLAMGGDGLVKFEIATKKHQQFRIGDGMPEDHANGLVLRGDVLYVGTHAGLARLNVRTMTWLPMSIGDPDAWLAANPVDPRDAAFAADYPPRVSIESPESGTVVTGLVDLKGRASRPGGAVSAVEVRVGEGAWTRASGTEEWTFTWDASALAPGSYVVSARAVSGNVTSSTDVVTLEVVALPKVPLQIHHTPPTGAAFAGRTLRIVADVVGDDPLVVRAYYQPAGESAYRELRLKRAGGVFVGDVPAEHAREGDLRYFIEAMSGRLTRTAPEDRREPFVLALRVPPPTSVSATGPPLVTVTTGATVTFPLEIENVGTVADNYVLEAFGTRSTWATYDATPFRLGPGETATREVAVAAPAKAFADNATLAFRVKPVASAAVPAEVQVPLRVVAAPPDPVVVKRTGGVFGIPGPEAALVALAAVLALALAARRRSA